MSNERITQRWNSEGEARVPGLENLEAALDLAEVTSKKGVTHTHGRIWQSAKFVGVYDGNKYRVRYNSTGKPGDTIGARDFDITGVDMGISVGRLRFSPYIIKVDYYTGQRNIREIMEGLEPIDQNKPQDTRLALLPQSINPSAPFMGSVEGLKEPYYIFAESVNDATNMYINWCEENEQFDAMHRAISDPNSPLSPFIFRNLKLFPLYLETARQNLEREQKGSEDSIKNVTPFET